MEDEYNKLCDEINQNAQISANIYLANITVTAILLGYAIKDNPIWYMFLSPFSIIIPSILLISSYVSSTIRIGTYIKLFIEPTNNELNWETRLQNLRNKNFMKSKHSSFSRSVSFLFILLGSFCLILSFIYAYKSQQINGITILTILVIIFLFAYGFYNLTVVSSRKYILDYLEAWKKIKDKEGQE
jgi:hypothetical protein